VEVSVDGGVHWQQAVIQEPVLSKALVRFRFPWEWHGQSALIQSRATDESGRIQPTRQHLIKEKGLNFYYHNNAIQSWLINQEGDVQNAHN
jgi:sulfane dehydrogenase subunit SoxC